MQYVIKQQVTEEVKESMDFVRGFLVLLQGTELFGPMIAKALEAIDHVTSELGC